MTTQLDNLDRLRHNLENSIAKLKESLQYWQTWEYEYEGLKEELERPSKELSADEMLAIGADLGLEVVDEREIKILVNYSKQSPRTRAQVITQIRGRIDTGQKNAATVKKQLAAAKEKLEKVLIVAEPAFDTEDGEQLMDIFEELDEQGNVVSSRVVNASKDRDRIHEILKDKGLTDVPEEEEPETSHAHANHEGHSPDGSSGTGRARKAAFEEAVQDQAVKAVPLSRIHPTQRMLILDKNDNVIDSKPLELVRPIPSSSNENEDPTIAHLREARASAQEIAPIVASFDLEPASDSEIDTDMDDDGSECSENEYGMGDIRTELTDDYKAQMEALMRKHAVAMENAGPKFDLDVIQKLDAAHRDAALVAKNTTERGPKSRKNGTKGVRFAEELDISSAKEQIDQITTKAKQTHQVEIEKVENPVSETVLERTSKSPANESVGSASRKPSRFKTTMNTSTNRQSKVDSQGEDGPAIMTNVISQTTNQEGTSVPERPKKVSRFKAATMGS